jgi:hypothetical protein
MQKIMNRADFARPKRHSFEVAQGAGSLKRLPQLIANAPTWRRAIRILECGG